MLMQLKNSEDQRRAINANFAKMAPLPIFQFLSYINIIFLKRTNFSHRIRIQEKIAQSYIKNFEKNQIFSFGLFHIGALCSKTLNAISRVKKIDKIFQFLVFCNDFDPKWIPRPQSQDFWKNRSGIPKSYSLIMCRSC